MCKPAPLLAALAIVALPPASVLAETLQVVSRIEQVTVQPDRAQVQRRASLAMPSGSHTLVIGDLPVALDRLSLSVTTSMPGVARRLTDERRQAQQERRLRQDAIRVNELTLDVLGRAQLNVDLAEQTGSGDPAAVFAMLESRSSAALAAIRAAELEIERLDAEIDRLERQLAQLGQDPMRRLEVTAAVAVEDSGPVELAIAYAVREAGFTPTLEARLDTRAEILTLAAAADVSQRTGEDWQDVALTLSTTQASWQTAAPPAETWYIDIERDEPRPLSRARESMAMADVALAAGPGLTIDRSSFDAAFRIDEPQSIAADGAIRRVPIQTLPLEAEMVWRTVPALDASAYLTASVTYGSDVPILPGTAQLYRDGMAIGETYQDGLQPGAELELGFGADPAVEVEYRLLTDRRGESGLIGTTRRHERRYAIEATNRRQGPVTLEVLERLPVPRDERIEVRLLSDTTSPDTESFDDRQGVLAWTRTIEPGDTLEIRVAYEVRHPADIDVTDF